MMKKSFMTLLFAMMVIQGMKGNMYEVIRRLKLKIFGAYVILDQGDEVINARLRVKNEENNDNFEAELECNFLGTAYTDELGDDGEIVWGDTSDDIILQFVEDGLHQAFGEIRVNADGTLIYSISGHRTVGVSNQDYLDALRGNRMLYTIDNFDIHLMVNNVRLLKIENGFKLEDGGFENLSDDFSGESLLSYFSDGPDRSFDSLSQASPSLLAQIEAMHAPKLLENPDQDGDKKQPDLGSNQRILKVERRALKKIIRSMGEFVNSYSVNSTNKKLPF